MLFQKLSAFAALMVFALQGAMALVLPMGLRAFWITSRKMVEQPLVLLLGK